MTRRTRLLSVIFLVLSPALHAQDGIGGFLERETHRFQWQQVDADMSPGEYQKALRHNRRLAHSTLQDTMVSLGVPSSALNLVGAAVVLAVDDLRVPLNKSKTLALKIEDAVDEDRSAVVQVRFAW